MFSATPRAGNQTQRDGGTHPRSHILEVAEPVFESRSASVRSALPAVFILILLKRKQVQRERLIHGHTTASGQNIPKLRHTAVRALPRCHLKAAASMFTEHLSCVRY